MQDVSIMQRPVRLVRMPFGAPRHPPLCESRASSEVARGWFCLVAIIPPVVLPNRRCGRAKRSTSFGDKLRTPCLNEVTGFGDDLFQDIGEFAQARCAVNHVRGCLAA